MFTQDPKHLLVKISQILHRLGIPYFISGGIAVVIWGRPRFTADIDIVVELEIMKAENLVKTLRSISKTGYVDEDAVQSALRNEGEFNYIDSKTGLKVDFWLLKKNDAFDQSRFKRRRTKKIAGKLVYFSSPEDLILVKLLWYKQTESTRHLEDIESVVAISGDQLDKGYLKEWSKILDVSNILKRYISVI